MGLGIPTLKIKLLLVSNPLKSRIFVRRLAELHIEIRTSKCIIIGSATGHESLLGVLRTHFYSAAFLSARKARTGDLVSPQGHAMLLQKVSCRPCQTCFWMLSPAARSPGKPPAASGGCTSRCEARAAHASGRRGRLCGLTCGRLPRRTGRSGPGGEGAPRCPAEAARGRSRSITHVRVMLSFQQPTFQK